MPNYPRTAEQIISSAKLPNYTLDYSSNQSVNGHTMREMLLIQSQPDYRHLHGQPLLSMKDAAKRLGIGMDSLYRLIGYNKLRTIKIGRRRLVTPQAIQEYIDAQETTSKQGGNYGF